MSNTIYHIHHIVPRHMGGTDEESNLIKLTVEEHAEAHRKLYEEYGKKEDFLAWKMLEGQVMIGENLRIKSKLGWEKANKDNPVCKGRKWYKNPLTNECKMLKPEDPVPDGWVRGRVRSNGKRDYKKVSEEHRQKVSKKVSMNGKIYKSGKELAKDYNVSPQAVVYWLEKGKAQYV